MPATRRCRRSPISKSRWFAVALALVSLTLGGLYALYRHADVEQLDLNEAARAQAPGRFVKLTDGYTHYDIGGPPNGPVVVLAAGFSVPYYIWDPTFAQLVTDGFRVLRYDYFGRGFSDRPAVAYDEEFYVRQLRELLDTLHVTQPIHLAGLSLGAAIVTSFADRHPDRVRSLIYFDPSFRSPLPIGALETRPRLWEVLTVLFDERSWAEGQLADFVHPERFPDWPARYRVQMQYRGFRRARLSEIVTNAAADQTDQLRRVAVHPRPVLVIWGKQDATVPFAYSELLMPALPHATLVAIDDAGHLPQLEQPDAVHAALRDFLKAASRPTRPVRGPARKR